MQLKTYILIGLSGIFISYGCSENEISNIPNPSEIPVDTVFQARSLKRGVSFDFRDNTEWMSLLAPAISWSYNWGPDQNAILNDLLSEHDIDFCPMTWNGSFDVNRIRAYKTAHPGCQYLLAFNEPNLKDQANMTPQQAAQKWPAVKAIADELGLKIISPAMNYGTLENYGDPIKWLDEFFTLIPITDIDGISIHCYMAHPSAAKSYIERFKKYNKPIWMTEFCAWEKMITKAEQQMKYMCDIINYMEADPDVFRYAWFIPRGDKAVDAYPYMYLLNKSVSTQLTELGKVFVNMSTQDGEAYYSVGQMVEAEHYTATSISESVGKSGWTDGPSSRPTTDGEGGGLELCNFWTDQWVEYQLNITESGKYRLDVRYASYTGVEMDLIVDAYPVSILTMPKTGEDFIWRTVSSEINLSKGKSTLGMKVKSGSLSMNWLKLSKI